MQFDEKERSAPSPANGGCAPAAATPSDDEAAAAAPGADQQEEKKEDGELPNSEGVDGNAVDVVAKKKKKKGSSSSTKKSDGGSSSKKKKKKKTSSKKDEKNDGKKHSSRGSSKKKSAAGTGGSSVAAGDEDAAGRHDSELKEELEEEEEEEEELLIGQGLVVAPGNGLGGGDVNFARSRDGDGELRDLIAKRRAKEGILGEDEEELVIGQGVLAPGNGGREDGADFPSFDDSGRELCALIAEKHQWMYRNSAAAEAPQTPPSPTSGEISPGSPPAAAAAAAATTTAARRSLSSLSPASKKKKSVRTSGVSQVTPNSSSRRMMKDLSGRKGAGFELHNDDDDDGDDIGKDTWKRGASGSYSVATTPAARWRSSATVPGAVRVEGIGSSCRSEDDPVHIRSTEDIAADEAAAEAAAVAAAAGDTMNKEDMSYQDTTETTDVADDPTERYLAPGDAKILAVANVIEEVDEELGMGVEFDPDAKPSPMYRTPRFRLYASMAFLVIVAVAIGAAVGGTVGRKDYGATGTAAPTTFRETIGIQDEVVKAVGSKVLEGVDSPYRKALDWTMNDDPMQLTANSSNLLQRYIAAYLYFATTVGGPWSGPWTSCNPPKDPWSGSVVCIFKKLVDTFTMEYEDITTNAWLTNSSECTWAGVSCDENGQILKVDLPGAGFSGTFPEGIFNWPYLQAIVFVEGTMSGPLPPQLAKMKNMVYIDLAYNQFTGSIPEDWWMEPKLQRLVVSGNKLTGSISTNIGNLKDIKHFGASRNQITGTLPSEIGLLDSLTIFEVNQNRIKGVIPSTIGNWKGVNVFWLQQNELVGTLPPAIGKLSNLEDLKVSTNMLTGTLPDSIYSLSHLQYLEVNNNLLQGTISSKIGQFGYKLDILDLSYNKFSGTIPTEFLLLSEMGVIGLEGNDITGEVPSDYCVYEGNRQSEILAEFRADCFPDDDGYIKLKCTCCTHCCLPDGTGCLPNPLKQSLEGEDRT